MLRILITGGRNPTALELVRLLHGPAVQIYLADSLYFPIGRHSRYVHHYVRTPRVAHHPQEYMQCLRTAVQRHRIDLLVPTYEETFYIARYRHQLEDLCAVFCDNFAKLKLLHNKWDFVHLAADCCIKAPPTFLLQTPEDVTLLQDDARYYVFKPVYSRFATQVLLRPDQQQLNFLRQAHYPWIAQWFVRGQEYCSYSVVHHGEVKAHVTYEHPYNLGQGSGIYYRAKKQHLVEQFVREFCEKYQYHGQIGFDFIHDAQDGKWYVIECNPRTVSGLHLFSPTDQLLSAVLGENSHPLYPGNPLPRVNLLTFLTYNGWRAWREKQLMRWGQDLLKAQDVIFRWDDPWPMLTQNLTLLEFCWFSLKYDLPLSDAISHDIAWDGMLEQPFAKAS